MPVGTEERFATLDTGIVLPHKTSFLKQSSSSTSFSTFIFTDPSKEGLMNSQIINCP